MYLFLSDYDSETGNVIPDLISAVLFGYRSSYYYSFIIVIFLEGVVNPCRSLPMSSKSLLDFSLSFRFI